MDEASQVVESWEPNLSPKQKAVFNCYKKYVLACGGRRNGKSIAVGHKVFRHLVEVPGARVALIATTIKAAKEGGAFADLIEIVAPIWFNANIYGETGQKVEYTSLGGDRMPGPKINPATRTYSFTIRNIHGGESELLLFSIDNENEIEAITKSKRFSMVWLSEGSNFKSDKVFKNVVQMLRMFHLRPEQHQLIVDTNPAEEGDQHWIYKYWFVDRLKDTPPKELALTKENPNGITQEEWNLVRQDFALFEFQLEDNPYLSKSEIAELKASNCDNAGDYDRNILGKWVAGFGLKGKIFADILDVGRHFIRGSIDVSELAINMVSGWDMGRVNHAGVIVEPRMLPITVRNKDGSTTTKDFPHYMVLDEVVVTDERVSTAEFARLMYEKMTNLEFFYQKRFKWQHWSDNSAWTFNASSADMDATIVSHATEGMVELEAANKARDSVDAGTKFMRQLLFENRLFVGSNCPKTQEMLQSITEKDVEEDTFLKHPFDALRYVIYMEERKYHIENASPRGIDRPPLRIIHVG